MAGFEVYPGVRAPGLSPTKGLPPNFSTSYFKHMRDSLFLILRIIMIITPLIINNEFP